MKILVSHTPEIDKKSESVSSVKVCCIYRAVFLIKSSEDNDALIDDLSNPLSSEIVLSDVLTHESLSDFCG